MVSTRNQSSRTPNAGQLFSIPTVYRPSTPGGRRIVEAMQGTVPQVANGESVRVTRSGNHHTPTPRSDRQTTSPPRRRSRATTAPRDDGAVVETVKHRSPSTGLSDAGFEDIGQQLIAASMGLSEARLVDQGQTSFEASTGLLDEDPDQDVVESIERPEQDDPSTLAPVAGRSSLSIEDFMGK